MNDARRPDRDPDTTAEEEQLSEQSADTAPGSDRAANVDAFGTPTGPGGSSGAADRADSHGSAPRDVSDADFGARPGQPSGRREDPGFTTSDPAAADEPVEGGESEVDE